MNTTNQPTENALSHLKDKAIRAHNWTSFSPEKRGQQMIEEYGVELNEDLAELMEKGASEESVNDYKARYERFFSGYLSAKSGTFSMMITGGGNFNCRKHAKANRSEQRHYEIFREWRTRAKKAIVRKAQPVKTFASELERYKDELAGMQRSHQLMKLGNKAIAKAKKEGADISQYLTETFNIAPHMIDWTMKFGFGLQNNNANMKRVEERIKALEAKENMRESNPITKYTFEGGEFLVNYEIDRVQIFFNDRPTKDELTAWKAKGLSSYNWSPSAKAWQRKITPAAFSQLKSMFAHIIKIN